MENLNEEWRDIKDYEGKYQVSNYGRVRSLDREIVYKDGRKRFFKGIILKPLINKTGYYQISLLINKHENKCFIHRLVAFAFPEICGEWFEGAEINHKDENPLNNIATNLEWCTSKYNINYGGHNKRMQLSLSKEIIQYSLDGCFLKKWESSEQAAKELNLSGSNIRKCCKINNRYKTVGGYIWRYSPK